MLILFNCHFSSELGIDDVILNGKIDPPRNIKEKKKILWFSGGLGLEWPLGWCCL